MPRACATPRASAIACGPQHLSSARERQSCGHTFIVIPTTSYPCCFSKYAATLESTPPLIPKTTRVPWAGRVAWEGGLFIGMAILHQNGDTLNCRTQKCGANFKIARGVEELRNHVSRTLTAARVMIGHMPCGTGPLRR